jgi:TrmH family RNA methyltransferase
MGEMLDVPPPNYSNRVSIILVRPQFDGNIGAVARSMMNFGFSDLRIVGRDPILSEEVRNRAKHAQSVLDNAKFFDDIESAVSDTSLVVGTSGKREKGSKISFRHFLEPEDLPEMLNNLDGNISIVFGPEGKGLLNSELRICDLLITIPTWPGYPIMNLSHAVTIICYAWYKSISSGTRTSIDAKLLSPKLKNILRQEITMLSEIIPTIDFRRSGIEETLHRVIMRGLPKDDEIHRLLGVLHTTNIAFEYFSKNPEIWEEIISDKS